MPKPIDTAELRIGDKTISLPILVGSEGERANTLLATARNLTGESKVCNVSSR